VKQTAAHEVANVDLLALMPPQASRVIEAGCSAGALAREYRKSNPDCEYVGIELESEYAELARRHCSRVLSADLEAMSDADLDALGAADCWVFGDVLEHMVDPWRVLARLPMRLAPRGCVVACIPNMQHWSVLARLATGQLFYEENGLLDRTHLRWFTRPTVMRLFQDAGFRITMLGGRRFNDPEAAPTIAAVCRLAAELGVDAEQAARDVVPLQWLVRAEPTGAA
jgi:2-polyprenyl-3-methyl-5-hydroxy-6-metoxy-1,4-benzoquinol methylase